MDEERAEIVPAYYRKLHTPGMIYNFDESNEAWAYKAVIDLRDEAIVQAAATLIRVYTEIGNYAPSGEDFYLLAELMSDAGWGDEEELQHILAATRPEIERRARERASAAE